MTAEYRETRFEQRTREALYDARVLVANSVEDGDLEHTALVEAFRNQGLAIVETHNPRCGCACHDAETGTYERDDAGLDAMFGCRRCTREVSYLDDHEPVTDGGQVSPPGFMEAVAEMDAKWARGGYPIQEWIAARAKADPAYAQMLMEDAAEYARQEEAGEA